MRPPPPIDNYSKFVDNYDRVNTSRTLAGRFLAKSHELLEASLRRDTEMHNIIEVGAGTGHHFSYVRENFDTYVMTDGSDDMLAIARAKYPPESYPGLILEKQDARNLTFADGSFDRLIATHVLEHIPAPVDALAEWDRVLRPGGILSLVLPCDPGLLWRLGRHLGPRRNARKAGLEYDYLMAVEHINSIYNLVAMIRYHFSRVDELWYPARFAAADLNLFYVCHIHKV